MTEMGRDRETVGAAREIVGIERPRGHEKSAVASSSKPGLRETIGDRAELLLGQPAPRRQRARSDRDGLTFLPIQMLLERRPDRGRRRIFEKDRPIEQRMGGPTPSP